MREARRCRLLSGTPRRSLRLAAAASLAVLGCGPRDQSNLATLGERGPSQVAAESTMAVAVPARSVGGVAWSAPRTQAPFALREIARRGGVAERDLLLRPVDVKITAQGTLVADFGSASIKAFRTSNGASAFEVGRRGQGPAELSGPPQLLGRYATPLVFQSDGGRLYRILSGALVGGQRVPSARPWLSACQLSDSTLLLQATPRPRSDPFAVATFGDVPRVVDTLLHPWPRLRDVPPIARQTPVAQADDSTCVLLPLLHRELASITRGAAAVMGLHPEELPPAVAAVDRAAEGTRYQVAEGAVYGAQAATAIAGLLGVLYEGRSADRRRVIDLFTREWAYVGSLRLPVETRAIAGYADTLALVGYENDLPVLLLYVLITA